MGDLLRTDLVFSQLVVKQTDDEHQWKSYINAYIKGWKLINDISLLQLRISS